MSDLYRINGDYHDKTKFRFIDNAITEGALVPDTRLQAITDAWNDPSDIGAYRRSENKISPELAALLDALTKEEH